MQFVNNKPIDLWMRKYGTTAYFILMFLIIWISKVESSRALIALSILSVVPAMDALVRATSYPEKVAIWVLASIAMYPLVHLIVKSRVLDRKLDVHILVKLSISVLLLDLVLVALAAHSAYSISMVGVGGRMFRLLATDLFGFMVIGSALSFVYSLGIAITWFSFSLAMNRK